MNLFKLFSRKQAPVIDLEVGDITKRRSDVIVNAAKQSLLGGGGVDGAIHKAGGPAILAQCRAIRDTLYPDGLPVGEAVPTRGGRLPARYVVHTVGPVYSTKEDRSAQLRSAYTSSLKVADQLHARTVAFPLISSGVYGWPVKDAIEQALKAISSRRYRHVQRVTLVLFDRDTFDLAQTVYREGRYWL